MITLHGSASCFHYCLLVFGNTGSAAGAPLAAVVTMTVVMVVVPAPPTVVPTVAVMAALPTPHPHPAMEKEVSLQNEKHNNIKPYEYELLQHDSCVH